VSSCLLYTCTHRVVSVHLTAIDFQFPLRIPKNFPITGTCQSNIALPISPNSSLPPSSHTFPLLISPHEMKFSVIISTIILTSIATALPLSLQERHALTNAVWLTPGQINLATLKKSRTEPSTTTQPESPLTTSELMGLRYQGPLRLRSVEIL
jgi:hypothetical protein